MDRHRVEQEATQFVGPIVRRFACIALILFVMFAASWPFRERILGTALERGRSACRRGDWRTSLVAVERWLGEHPDDLDALRIKARDLAGLGRGVEAITLFGQLGGQHVQSADLMLVGDALIKEKRPVLGLAALNAAAKLDPKNQDVLKELARFSSSQRIDPPLAKMSEGLASLAFATGLAGLVLALAVTDKTEDLSADPPTILLSILRSDRGVFLGIDGPSAARKLVARRLLERGRTVEARTWLGRAGEQDDLDVNWLKSRALLAERKPEAADDALAAAKGYGRDDLTAHEPAPYVGAKRCSECHKAIYQAQQHGAHASTVATGAGLDAVPLPKGPVRDPGNPDVTHQIGRSGGELRLESRADGCVIGAVLDYALGSGRHGMTMLARQESGVHRQMRISYYGTGGDHWDLTSGFDRRPANPDSYIGEPVSEEGFVRCLNCHTTRFTSENERKGPEAADHGIGCERCHGPGDHHLRSVELGFPEPAFGRPRSATPRQRLNICKECHGADRVIRPTDPRFVRFQAATLPFSRCVSESNGRLDCVACHDPHRDLEKDHAYYEIRCLACHGGGKPGGPPSRPEGLRIEAIAASRCPVNAASSCIGCHMPKARELVPFTDFTDHHIRVHKTDVVQ